MTFGVLKLRVLLSGFGALLVLAGSSVAAPDTPPTPKPRPALLKLLPPTEFPTEGKADGASPTSTASGTENTLVSPGAREPGPLTSPAAQSGSAGVAGEARLPKARPEPASVAALVLTKTGSTTAAPEADLRGRAAAGPPVAPPPAAAPIGADTANPLDNSASEAGSIARDAAGAIDLLARVPRARPGNLPAGALAMVAPRAQLPEPGPPLGPPVPVENPVKLAACHDHLRKLGVAFQRVEAIDGGGGCQVANPLTVTSLGSGVRLTSEATLNCATTEAVALWVRDVLLPSARDDLHATPTGIVPGSTYACRSRNNQAGARISEHARANAFDVMSIEFANRPPLEIRARASGEPDEKYQKVIRQGSCAYFTTVLGPGSDASHANHLHFDLAQRRGGHRLCSMGDERTAETAPAAP